MLTKARLRALLARRGATMAASVERFWPCGSAIAVGRRMYDVSRCTVGAKSVLVAIIPRWAGVVVRASLCGGKRGESYDGIYAHPESFDYTSEFYQLVIVASM